MAKVEAIVTEYRLTLTPLEAQQLCALLGRTTGLELTEAFEGLSNALEQNGLDYEDWEIVHGGYHGDGKPIDAISIVSREG